MRLLYWKLIHSFCGNRHVQWANGTCRYIQLSPQENHFTPVNVSRVDRGEWTASVTSINLAACEAEGITQFIFALFSKFQSCHSEKMNESAAKEIWRVRGGRETYESLHMWLQKWPKWWGQAHKRRHTEYPDEKMIWVAVCLLLLYLPAWLSVMAYLVCVCVFCSIQFAQRHATHPCSILHIVAFSKI